VALPAFAAALRAERRAAAAVDRHLLPARRSAANPPQRRARASDGTDGQTDAQTDSLLEPAPHTTLAVPMMQL